MTNTIDDSFFTEEEKNETAYAACVLGQGMVGAAVGAAAGGVGAPAGAAVGALIGLATCKYLKEPIKKKIFSFNKMTENEIGQSVSAIKAETGITSNKDALKVLALVRKEYAKNPGQNYLSMTKSSGGMSFGTACTKLVSRTTA